MYKKLAGMTGTAETEAAEFQKIYNLDVTVIPTNRAMVRKEYPDMVYRTEEEKFRNAAKEIKELHEKGQPVLVGTISVEKSERLSGILKRMGVRHEVLNAKNHEREAFIVAQAGRKGAVTVSTNMAGRGTDILLGGNAEFMTKDACLKRRGQRSARQGNRSRRALLLLRHRSSSTGCGATSDEFARYKQQTDKEHDEVSRWAGLHIWARSATSRGASTTSCAVARDARATRAARAFIFLCRTICCAFSAASACRSSCCDSAWKRMCRSNRS